MNRLRPSALHAAVLAAALAVLGGFTVACASSPPAPAGGTESTELPAGSDTPLPAAGGPGGSPSAGSAAGGSDGAAGEPEDPEAALDKSLKDFDGQMAEEQARMARAGQGSSRSADTRQTGDASAVERGARKGGVNVGVSLPGAGAGLPGMGGGMGGVGMGGGMDGGGQDGKGARGGKAGKADGGDGQDAGDGDANGPAKGGGDAGSGKDLPGMKEGSGEKGGLGKVAQVPPDIPQDGSGEDQVARQLKEAAMAETDPEIREALWNEYRKYMGIKVPR